MSRVLLAATLAASLLLLPRAARADEPAAAPAGAYGGIGASVEVKDGKLVFTRVYDDGSAAKAGLKVGDRVYTIDRMPADGMPVAWAIARIRGLVGTTVQLAVEAADGSGARVVSLAREPRGAK